MHEALLLIKILQAKPQVRSKNINFHDLYFPIVINLTDEGGED